MKEETNTIQSISFLKNTYKLFNERTKAYVDERCEIFIPSQFPVSRQGPRVVKEKQ